VEASAAADGAKRPYRMTENSDVSAQKEEASYAFSAEELAALGLSDLAAGMDHSPDKTEDENPLAGCLQHVHYHRKPNRYPGDHFAIRVDDNNGELQYIGGR
jgi:hypothetical protein